MHVQSYRSFARALVAGALLATLAVPSLASAQSYPYSGSAYTTPDYAGGYSTYYSNGGYAHSTPDYAGGYSTYYSNGGYSYSTPDYAGGFYTYYSH
jgi:hypothetical protein